MGETQGAIPRCQSGELWKEDFHLNAYHSSPRSDNIICFQRKIERLNAELFPGALRSGVLFFFKKKIILFFFLGGERIAPISPSSSLLKALQSCSLRKEGMARGRCSFSRIAHRQWLQGPATQQDLSWGGRSLLQKSVCLPHTASSSECLLCLPLEALHRHLLVFSCLLLPGPMALCSGSDCSEAKHIQPQPANAPALLFAVRLQGRPQAPANPHLCWSLPVLDAFRVILRASKHWPTRS